ncbi:hypothetical protein TIFTF001_029817 [Ficus carica]|uniref:Uncharacterized protein n=1 Tax=Ficus carica TaxID=3494 RepID=A0AA88IYN1_FICCA|nr:hypothetical protein TIFTF001_029817 [Ficus carica]
MFGVGCGVRAVLADARLGADPVNLSLEVRFHCAVGGVLAMPGVYQ